MSQERRQIFFTSDWHIGHTNVIRLSQRPFRDVEHMAEVLVNNFNACARPGALTYFLGDMGLCKGEELKAVVSKLNGTKVLVLGNHDKNHEAMFKIGFDAVVNSATIYVAHQRVTLSHCPLRGVWREATEGMKDSTGAENWHGEAKQVRFSIADEGQFHLHGHIHSPNGGKSERLLGRQMDVGVDANKYRPVSISEVESWISKYGRSK
jgi:calcineurin-like phosphoesterase family protein